MKNIFFAITAIIFFGFFGICQADVLNPVFFKKQCQPKEQEVICHYETEEPFGPITYDGCRPYEQSNSYYYLIGTGSSFGGQSKYCLKQGAKPIDISQYDDDYFRENNSNRDFIISVGSVLFCFILGVLGIIILKKKNVSK